MNKVRFGDVVRDVKVNVDRAKNPYEYYVAGEHMDTDELRILRRGKFSEPPEPGPAFIRAFQPGYILYGSRRTYLRKIAVADFEGVCANTTFVLETKDENVFMQRLLPFLMYSERFTQYSIKNSKGSTNPYILFSDLAQYEFNLPPIEEQRKLADLLWAAVEARNAYKELLAKTDELVKAQFVEMFGDPGTNPMGWVKKPLSETCNITTGNTPPRANPEYYGDYIEWIKTDNIVPKSSVLTPAVEYLSTKGFEKCRYVDAGSILMTCIAGSLNTIGNVAITDRRVAFNQQINALTPISYNTVFLYCLLTMIKDELCGSANKMLKGIISKGRLSEIEVIVPPMDQQNRFADIVRQSDISNAVLQRTLDELNSTYQALLREHLG